jgi:lipopolysaccharide/colanic/teichoic acid biosynthesis glycosyltransferase
VAFEFELALSVAMFVRMPRSVVLLTSETCLLVAVVVASTFLPLGVLLAPIAVVLAMSLVPSWRPALAWLLSRFARSERLLIVGTGPSAVELARELNDRRHELGIEIVGFADSTVERIGRTILGCVVGAVEKIPAMIRTSGADRVVVSLSEARGRLPVDRLLDIRLQTDVAFDDLASAYETYTGKIAVETLRPSWFVFSSGFRQTRLLLFGKRTLDVGLALAGLVVTAPIVLVSAALVRLTSPGAAFDLRHRVGLYGRVFTMYTLRTTREDADPSNDGVTPIGRVLRATRIAQVPQLWNVLRGDMSIVGPRPERPRRVAQLASRIAFFTHRHVLKPGLTGWAQIHKSSAAGVDDAVEPLQYDLYYIKNLSLWLDLLILVETARALVRRRHGWSQA